MIRYEKRGMLAVNPRAFFELFAPLPARSVKQCGPASVVEIQGPLVHHEGQCFDSYDSIAERVAIACAATPAVIVLKIDSPGGDVSGCFDTAREIKAKCAAAGKRLVTYVDGCATSAAYALACAAEEIVVPATGLVGSIGVLNVRVDATRVDQAMGLVFELTGSGERKTFGNVHQALTDEERATTQAMVDQLAGVFFDLVAEARGIPVEIVSGLQAGLVCGADAVRHKLADRVSSFDELLATLAAPPVGTGSHMASHYEEARAALGKAAEGDGDEAKKARKALAAMDAEGDESDKDEEKDESAESDAPPSDKDEKKKDEAVSTAAQLAQTVVKLSAQVSAMSLKSESQERDAFLASRPDLPAALVSVLKGKPLSEITALVAAIPAPVKPSTETLTSTAATLPGTRGAGQESLPAAGTIANAEIDARMGLTTYKMASKIEGNVQTFGAMPVARKEIVK